MGGSKMWIIKNLEVSGKENIKESIIKACIYEKKAIVFCEDTLQRIKQIRPEKPEQSRNAIPIRKDKILGYENDDGIELYAYDSLNESFAVAWKRINDNLYLLERMRYKNKVEGIEINYEINSVLKYTSIALLKLKKRI